MVQEWKYIQSNTISPSYAANSLAILSALTAGPFWLLHTEPHDFEILPSLDVICGGILEICVERGLQAEFEGLQTRNRRPLGSLINIIQGINVNS